jgi:urea transporter
MSLDIVMALFAGVAVGLTLLAVIGGFCYVTGIPFESPAAVVALAGGGFAVVATLRLLERAATRETRLQEAADAAPTDRSSSG